VHTHTHTHTHIPTPTPTSPSPSLQLPPHTHLFVCVQDHHPMLLSRDADALHFIIPDFIIQSLQRLLGCFNASLIAIQVKPALQELEAEDSQNLVVNKCLEQSLYDYAGKTAYSVKTNLLLGSWWVHNSVNVTNVCLMGRVGQSLIYTVSDIFGVASFVSKCLALFPWFF